MLAPVAMLDPLHDTTPTRTRILATVPMHHELHLTLPPRPPQIYGEQGFAVVELHGPVSFVAEALQRDPMNMVTYSVRFWGNPVMEPVTDLVPPGSYMSIRGCLQHTKRLVTSINVMCSVVHSSPNFLE